MTPIEINMFLACSLRYVEERDKLQIVFNGPQTRRRFGKNVSITLYTSDNMGLSMSLSKKGHQAKINELVKICDLVILLYGTDVREFTVEEFHVARKEFKKTKKAPKIMPLLKHEPIKQESLAQENLGIEEIWKILKEHKHYEKEYLNIHHLIGLVGDEIDIYLEEQETTKINVSI
jgi:hypothetical protein